MEQDKKPYHLMTQAERTADRIARNKVIDTNTAKIRSIQKMVREQKAARDLAISAKQTLDQLVSLNPSDKEYLESLLGPSIKGYNK